MTPLSEHEDFKSTIGHQHRSLPLHQKGIPGLRSRRFPQPREPSCREQEGRDYSESYNGNQESRSDIAIGGYYQRRGKTKLIKYSVGVFLWFWQKVSFPFIARDEKSGGDYQK